MAGGWSLDPAAGCGRGRRSGAAGSGDNVYDGVAFNDIATNEATIGADTGFVHVTCLRDTDTAALAFE